MKRYSALVVLLLVLFVQTAYAGGPQPPAGLAQSTTPTATHQVYMPVVGGSNPETPEVGVQAGSIPLLWWLGVIVLIVLIVLYAVFRISARRK